MYLSAVLIFFHLKITGEQKKKKKREGEMKIQFHLIVPSLVIFFLLISSSPVDAQSCKPSGYVRSKKPPPGHCTIEEDLCCIKGRLYPINKCSPRVSNHTKAVMTLDTFEKGGDDARPSACDNKYHSDDAPVVALSSGWYNDRSRCLENITIYANGRSVKAMVVDHCDSTMGCDAADDFFPPCGNNLVTASTAVWKALEIPNSQWGEIDIIWSDH